MGGADTRFMFFFYNEILLIASDLNQHITYMMIFLIKFV